jgi:type I restriction enzyme S subunit
MSTSTTYIETDNQLVPELRFKEFDGDIEETLFGSHYSFHTTNSLSRDKLNYDKGEVRNIHYGDIHTKFQTHFNLANEYVPLINDDVDLAKIKEDSYCKVGDLVIADASEDYADIGKSIELIDINNEKLLAGLHTFLARPSSESTAVGYISCLLKSWKLRKQIMTIAQGTKVLSLSAGRVSNLKLNLPSLPEQQKIASFLSAVDEKIQQLTKKKALLEQYKKGVMQQLFSGQLRFKDENGNTYPDWEEKRLAKFLKYYDGTHQTPKYVEKGVPFYSVEHITRNQFSKTKFITEEVFEKENKRVKLEKGDILMTRIGDIGTARLIDWDVRASFYVSLALLKQNPSYDSTYLNQYISSVPFQKELWAKTIHVAFPKKINLGEIGNCKAQLPCIEEQQKIASYLSGIDTKIESVNNQITQTQTFKKGLLQQIFV